MADDKRNTDDLADVLGDLADGKQPDADDDQPTPHDQTEIAETNERIQAEHTQTDDAELVGVEQIIAGPTPGPSRRRRPAGAGGSGRRQKGPTPLARHGVKACLIIGMLLLIPALWAVGILIDLPVPMSGRSSADAMAYLMLLCWPIAGALIWGAFHFARQHAAWDARQSGNAE